MMKRHSSNLLLAFALAGFVLLYMFKSELLAPDTGEALAATAEVKVRATPIPLNISDPNQKRVGALTYLGGWALTSPHERFGGFSGLVVENANRLVAISDQGDWFTAQFSQGGNSVLTDTRLHPFDPSMESEGKISLDAESIIVAGDEYLVSFEQRHRLVMSRPGGQNRLWGNGNHINFGAVADNSGMEAIAWTKDGQLLAFTERGVDTQGRLRAWLVDDDGAALVYFKPPLNFSPTDAARLPNGDMLVLLRSFSLADGVKVKLLQVKAADIHAGNTFDGQELAHLEPPLAVDNMEGLDIGVAPDGSIIVYMLSDDNFSASQRTLLLTFALDQH